MRFGSAPNVLANRMPKYWKLSGAADLDGCKDAREVCHGQAHGSQPDIEGWALQERDVNVLDAWGPGEEMEAQQQTRPA